MSFELKGIGDAPSNLDVNMIPGPSRGVEDQEVVMRFRIEDAESVISLESFCQMVRHYLPGGVGGYGGHVPGVVRRTVKELVQNCL